MTADGTLRAGRAQFVTYADGTPLDGSDRVLVHMLRAVQDAAEASIEAVRYRRAINHSIVALGTNAAAAAFEAGRYMDREIQRRIEERRTVDDEPETET